MVGALKHLIELPIVAKQALSNLEPCSRFLLKDLKPWATQGICGTWAGQQLPLGFRHRPPAPTASSDPGCVLGQVHSPSCVHPQPGGVASLVASRAWLECAALKGAGTGGKQGTPTPLAPWGQSLPSRPHAAGRRPRAGDRCRTCGCQPCPKPCSDLQGPAIRTVLEPRSAQQGRICLHRAAGQTQGGSGQGLGSACSKGPRQWFANLCFIGFGVLGQCA